MDLNAQHALVDFHILPEDYENQDYYRLLEVMNAREREDRPLELQAVNADDFLARLGL